MYQVRFLGVHYLGHPYSLCTNWRTCPGSGSLWYRRHQDFLADEPSPSGWMEFRVSVTPQKPVFPKVPQLAPCSFFYLLSDLPFNTFHLLESLANDATCHFAISYQILSEGNNRSDHKCFVFNVSVNSDREHISSWVFCN